MNIKKEKVVTITNINCIDNTIMIDELILSRTGLVKIHWRIRRWEMVENKSLQDSINKAGERKKKESRKST